MMKTIIKHFLPVLLKELGQKYMLIAILGLIFIPSFLIIFITNVVFGQSYSFILIVLAMTILAVLLVLLLDVLIIKDVYLACKQLAIIHRTDIKKVIKVAKENDFNFHRLDWWDKTPWEPIYPHPGEKVIKEAERKFYQLR